MRRKWYCECLLGIDDHRNQVFDITKGRHYNVGVEQVLSTFDLHLYFYYEVIIGGMKYESAR